MSVKMVMARGVLRGILVALLASLSMAFAGTLTVKSPTEGQFLGLNNSIKFQITGAVVNVTVKATVTGPNGTIVVEDDFTPDGNGKIDNQLSLNFNQNTPEGDYSIKVEATEPNNTYTPTTLNVKVDTNKPKFLSFVPSTNSFVRGQVKIRAKLKETNPKQWEVKVDGNPIPNNTGTGLDVSADWDASTLTEDGEHTITIVAKDQADNSQTQSISVTLDRNAPVTTIAFPRSDTKLQPGTTIAVIVDVRDASSSSVDVTGLDVVARKLDGTYITRVSRVSVKANGSDTMRWTGRIRYQRGLLPSKFKLVVTAVDKAGNVATKQEVTVTIG
jgi:hypothetical protein